MVVTCFSLFFLNLVSSSLSLLRLNFVFLLISPFVEVCQIETLIVHFCRGVTGKERMNHTLLIRYAFCTKQKQQLNKPQQHTNSNHSIKTTNNTYIKSCWFRVCPPSPPWFTLTPIPPCKLVSHLSKLSVSPHTHTHNWIVFLWNFDGLTVVGQKVKIENFRPMIDWRLRYYTKNWICNMN